MNCGVAPLTFGAVIFNNYLVQNIDKNLRVQQKPETVFLRAGSLIG